MGAAEHSRHKRGVAAGQRGGRGLAGLRREVELNVRSVLRRWPGRPWTPHGVCRGPPGSRVLGGIRSRWAHPNPTHPMSGAPPDRDAGRGHRGPSGTMPTTFSEPLATLRHGAREGKYGSGGRPAPGGLRAADGCGRCRTGALPGVRERQMSEDLADDARIVHRGDEAQTATTVGARQHIRLERAVHERCPGPIARGLQSSGAVRTGG